MDIKRIICSNWIKAIGLNLIYMFAMILFFEQFATYDDYTMAVQYAGGIGDKYALGQTFVNPLYGYFVFGLNRLFPMLPWFNILLFLFQFIGFTLVTYAIFETYVGPTGVVICNIILLFFSYEAYAGTCFTKVAGLIAVSGLFFLLSQKGKWWHKGFAWILIAISVLLRNAMMIMALGICFVFMMYNFLRLLSYGKEMNKKRVIKSIAFVLMCIALYWTLSNEKIWFQNSELENFQQQLEENAVRSRFQDYPIAEYKEYENSYKKIDVSENDIYLFRQWNYDRKKLTKEVYKVLDLTEEKSLIKKVFSWENICDFFKCYPKNFYYLDVFFCLVLIIAMLFFMVKKEQQHKLGYRITFVIILNLGLMYYFFINGRFNQHRVDIVVEYAMIMGLVGLCADFEFDDWRQRGKRTVLPMLIMLMLCPYSFHDDFVWGKIGDEQRKEIETFNDSVAQDKDHFYLLGYTAGDVDIFKMYSLNEVTRNKYHNRCVNTSMVSNFYDDDYLKEYGIDDLYLNAVNNEVFRFVINDNNPDIEQWKKYFQERSGKKIELNLVKKCHTKNIYLIQYAKENILKQLKKENEVDGQFCDIQIDLDYKKNNRVKIDGSAYIEGSDAFPQVVYLQIEDDVSGKIQQYVLTQQINEMKENEGKYSKIDETIELPDFYSNNDSILLIVQDGDKWAMKEIQ